MSQQTITQEGCFDYTVRTQINDNFTEIYNEIGGGSGDISTNNITMAGNMTIATGKAIGPDTTTAHTALLRAYDVDGTAYKTFATLTNGNTPSFAIAAPAGGTVAIDGAVIGGVTPAAATVTTGTINTSLTFADVANIIVNATTGTKIGTATSQKLGFYNAAPVVQQAGVGVTTAGFTAGSGAAVLVDSTFTGNIGSTAYHISDVVAALKNLGLLAS